MLAGFHQGLGLLKVNMVWSANMDDLHTLVFGKLV
jgi:hypothetical protein